jgi:hypothetical protein
MQAELAIGQAINQMLKSHPRPSTLPFEVFSRCVEDCMICATTCTACADACLAEGMVQQLVQCIRTNLDCADICQATGHILVRQTEPDRRLLRHQVEACQTACRTCAAICEQHAQMHEHCRVCAEVCRRCEQACGKLLATFQV